MKFAINDLELITEKLGYLQTELDEMAKTLKSEALETIVSKLEYITEWIFYISENIPDIDELQNENELFRTILSQHLSYKEKLYYKLRDGITIE